MITGRNPWFLLTADNLIQPYLAEGGEMCVRGGFRSLRKRDTKKYESVFLIEIKSVEKVKSMCVENVLDLYVKTEVLRLQMWLFSYRLSERPHRRIYPFSHRKCVRPQKVRTNLHLGHREENSLVYTHLGRD